MGGAAPDDAGADNQRKTRKIRISDHEREVLIRTLEQSVADATDAAHEAVLKALLGQITPKKRPTTQRYKPYFVVRWRADGREQDCGHEHTSHLEATDCAQQHASRGHDTQVIPMTRPAEG